MLMVGTFVRVELGMYVDLEGRYPVRIVAIDVPWQVDESATVSDGV
jgi:hypothetical protein